MESFSVKKHLLATLVLVLTFAIQAFCDNLNSNGASMVQHVANTYEYQGGNGGTELKSNFRTKRFISDSAPAHGDRRKRQVHLTGSEITWDEAQALLEKHNIRRRNETSSNMRFMVSYV